VQRKILYAKRDNLAAEIPGISKIDIFGAKLGPYSREDRLTTEDYEMLCCG
jgi:hypothetical protein